MLRFHTPGIPKSAEKYNILSGLERVAEMGLDGIEIPFTRGVRMGSELAEKVKAKKEELDLTITLHGPFWINLNSKEKQKQENSIQYILDTVRKAEEVGAESITFHPAYMHDDDQDVVLKRVTEKMTEVLAICDSEGLSHIQIAPELTGKPSQFGSLDNLIEVSSALDGRISLCIDFSHFYARTQGEENGVDSFKRTIDTIASRLSPSVLNSFHMHMGGMIYGPKGEKKHRPLMDETEFHWQELLQTLKTYGVSGWVSVETPDIEESTALAKKTYDSF